MGKLIQGSIGSHIYELRRRKYPKAKEDITVTAEATGHL